MREKTVLCYLNRGNEYLFLHRNKRKNDLNEGKWIGVGGHIEIGETKEEALIREVKEETGLTLKSYTYRGEIYFVNDDYSEIMYLYISDDFAGELIDCDEGQLAWINKDKVFDLNLWEGDRAFLKKLFFTNEIIKMTLVYKGKKLVEIKEGGF